MSERTYERYRFTHPDGRARDRAIRVNPDGSYTARWGPADRLAGTMTRAERYGGEVEALERSKLRKGYVLLDRVALDPGPPAITPAHSLTPRIDLSQVDTGGDDFWF